MPLKMLAQENSFKFFSPYFPPSHDNIEYLYSLNAVVGAVSCGHLNNLNFQYVFLIIVKKDRTNFSFLFDIIRIDVCYYYYY